MNTPRQTNNFLRCALLAGVLAAVFLVPTVHAQPTEQTVENRFLFIFDTSKSMKPRIETVQRALNTLLATSFSGQLHKGDTIGVWTFNEELQTKGFPLQTWDPDNAVVIASNIVRFVGRQSYAKTTHLEGLQPLLNRVVQDSQRLTVIIFCDGDGKITGTPSDDAINQALKEKSAEQKKAHEPLVIALRSQLGQYIGAAVSQPPRPVNVPPFPPLPLPPPPAPAANPKPTNTPPPTPVVIGQPLIIIGKKPPAIAPPPATNPPAVIPAPLPVVPTNAVMLVTNPVVAKSVDLTPTNPPPAMPASPDSDNKNFLFIGAGLIIAALVLGVFVGLRFRRKESSLISQTMNDRR
ncbi:MAG: vWA domain-containing protein [Limisphaerales bacterium]